MYVSEKRFKKIDVSHVITKNRPFPRKVDIKDILTEISAKNDFFKKKKSVFTCDLKI